MPVKSIHFAAIFLLFISTAFAKCQSQTYFQQSGSSVMTKDVRFQILTPTLVRMEYSASGKFIDAPTIVVLNRKWPDVNFTANEENGHLVIQTTNFTVFYKLNSGKFQKENMKISWKNKGREFSWAPGDSDRQNLGGITYSLDGARKGKIPQFPPGILTRNGYFLLDDSNTPLRTEADSWIAPRGKNENQDWYFFVYGNDYKHVLKEYADLCGNIPMIPRYTLGTWITDLNYEYLPGTEIIDKFKYTDEDVKKIAVRLREADIPVDVYVLDFAWHNLGWKGSYDWSPIFPEPDAFMKWAKDYGLKISLNDHPGYAGEGVLSNDDSRAGIVRELLNILPPLPPTITMDISKDWKFKTDPDTAGISENWHGMKHDDKNWAQLQTPSLWEDHGYPGYDGHGWYRKWVTLSDEGKNDSLYIIFGGVDDEYDLFINGNKVSHHGEPNGSVYNTLSWTYVTPYLKFNEKNLIVLRVNDWGGGGGIVSGPVTITDRLPAAGIRFNLAKKKDADIYMNVLHKPLIDQGTAFWWVDGGRGSCDMEGLNSQLWTNHVFYNYTEQQTNKRGFIFSRYGGWGNHRYPSYFTGDTYADWDVLAYQVPFTAQGGNVLMPYITHDIGGFIYKDISFRLYARWLQFGVFSPFVRLHSAYENPKDGNARMPWTYGQEGMDLVRKYSKIRYSLLPYIYSYTRVAHEQALPLVRPLYLEYPGLDKAYSYPYQYFFGKEFLVAPVIDSTDFREIYLPPGEWIDYFSGKIYSGDRVIKDTYPIEAMPVFVRSGSIIVTQPDMQYSDQRPADHLIINVYGTTAGSFELYEDDGLSLDYSKGKYAKTEFTYKTDKSGKSIVEIGPTKGTYNGQVEKRSYTIRIPIEKEVTSVTVNKEKLSDDKWKWDKGLSTMFIEVGKTNITESIKIEVK